MSVENLPPPTLPAPQKEEEITP